MPRCLQQSLVNIINTKLALSLNAAHTLVNRYHVFNKNRVQKNLICHVMKLTG